MRDRYMIIHNRLNLTISHICEPTLEDKEGPNKWVLRMKVERITGVHTYLLNR